MRANMAALGSRETRLHAREEDFSKRSASDRATLPHDPAEALTRRPPVAAADGDGDRHSREIALDERMEVDLSDLGPAPADAVARDDEPTRMITGEALVAAPPPEPVAVAPEERARWAARGDRPYVAVVEGEVRVWFQGTPEVSAQLAGATVVPVLQIDPDATLPHALLTLRGESGAPVYTRVALDVTRPEDRAVLESLARDFRVRAEVVSALGRALGATALSAPCEQNAARALEVLTLRAPGDPDASAAAVDHLRAHGLALTGRTEGEHLDPVPLGDEHALVSAAGVTGALAALEPLLDPARLDRYVLGHGVSASQIDAFTKRLGLAALRCGVVPSGAFIRRALALGVAADERALAARALTAYARTCEGGVASIGRAPRDASRAWGALLAWAARLGVTPSEAVRVAIGSVYDPDDPESVHPPESRTAPAADAYHAMTDAEPHRLDRPPRRAPPRRPRARPPRRIEARGRHRPRAPHAARRPRRRAFAAGSCAAATPSATCGSSSCPPDVARSRPWPPSGPACSSSAARSPPWSSAHSRRTTATGASPRGPPGSSASPRCGRWSAPRRPTPSASRGCSGTPSAAARPRSSSAPAAKPRPPSKTPPRAPSGSRTRSAPGTTSLRRGEGELEAIVHPVLARAAAS